MRGGAVEFYGSGKPRLGPKSEENMRYSRLKNVIDYVELPLRLSPIPGGTRKIQQPPNDWKRNSNGTFMTYRLKLYEDGHHVDTLYSNSPRLVKNAIHLWRNGEEIPDQLKH